MKGENVHPLEPGGGNLTPVRARGLWMPPSMRLALSRAASVINRHESFARNAIHLPIKLAHYNRSASPLHWSQLPLNFLTENCTHEDAGETPPTHHARAADVSMNQPPPTASQSSATTHTRPVVTLNRRAQTVSPILQTALNPGAVKVSDFVAARAGSISSVRNSWQPISLAVKDNSGVAEDSRTSREVSAARKSNFQFEEDAASTPVSASQGFSPRLNLSTWHRPRREVQGGFPYMKTPLAMGAEDEPQRARVETLTPREEALADDALRVAPLRSTPSQILQPSYTPASQPVPQGAIEKLIARSIMPAQLPGLEMRLLTPEEQSSRFNDAREASETQHQAAHDKSENHAGAFAQPPETSALNINEVADRVYQTLVRRQQLERERRGLY
ncbi:MAG: hypothetical protein LC731_07550 [Acidobacteria bacterium]|nr:hypothetical protein [Acidobacteriota bacterium]